MAGAGLGEVTPFLAGLAHWRDHYHHYQYYYYYYYYC